MATERRSGEGGPSPRSTRLLEWIALALAGLLALETLQRGATVPPPAAPERASLSQPGPEEARRLIRDMLTHD